MNVHAIICTRTREDISETTDKLLGFFSRCKIKSYLITGANSIFAAYTGAYKKINPQDDDIVIFCHDDIEIRDHPNTFVNNLISSLADDSTGFVGAAGTTHLTENAIWWDQSMWQQGKHKGKVIHLNHEQPLQPNQFGMSQQTFEDVTYYGEPGDVVVLDGLFLAAKPKVLEDVGLGKPEYFEGEWDFYDLHYTSQAFLKGYTNKVMPIKILHNSRGELVGRDSWHKNREAFITHTELPLILHP